MFRAALERDGVATSGWWDRQLEKALGDGVEPRWWCDAAGEGLGRL